MKSTQNTIAIYSRKSKFTGKGESIGNHVELCREYIRFHYGDKDAEQAEVFEDERFSGGKQALTQREVAERTGISRSYVSRIEKRALAKLRRALDG